MGGLTLWEASIEARIPFPLSVPLSGVIFVDASDLTSNIGVIRTDAHGMEGRPMSGRRRRLLTGTLLIVALVAGSGWIAAKTFVSARAAELDENLIAVAPFRVTGADPAIAYLHEGLVDLIGVKLTGAAGGGPGNDAGSLERPGR